jgi:hypothetical protein
MFWWWCKSTALHWYSCLYRGRIISCSSCCVLHCYCDLARISSVATIVWCQVTVLCCSAATAHSTAMQHAVATQLHLIASYPTSWPVYVCITCHSIQQQWPCRVVRAVLVVQVLHSTLKLWRSQSFVVWQASDIISHMRIMMIVIYRQICILPFSLPITAQCAAACIVQW